MTKQEPPETCAWCARRTNQGHRPNCPRPGEVFTATDLRNARAEATAAAEQRLEALEGALSLLLEDTEHKDHDCGDEEWCPVRRARDLLEMET